MGKFPRATASNARVGLTSDLRVAVGDARQAEVENLGLAGVVDQNVAGLQIAMNDGMLMGGLDRLADFNHQSEALADVQMMRVGVVDQRLAMDAFRGEKRLRAEAGVGGAGLVDLRDAGVMETT